MNVPYYCKMLIGESTCMCVCVLVVEGRVHGNSMPFSQFFSKANASLKNFLLKKMVPIIPPQY